MKKVIKTMMMMLVASTFVLTSCKDDDEIENVKLTINPDKTSGTHAVGDSLKIVINAVGNSDNKLKKLTILESKTGGAPVTLVSEELSGTDKVYTFTHTFTLAESDQSPITYTIKVAGEKGTEQSISYVATVIKVNPINVLVEPGLTLWGQGKDAENFAQLADPFTPFTKSLTADDMENKVDIAFYYGASNQHTLSSPDDAVMQGLYSGLTFWDKARTTGLYRMPAADAAIFAEIIADDNDTKLIEYAQGKTFSKTITQLISGEVILYKTKEGKLGMMKLKAVVGATNSTASLSYIALVQL